MSEAKIDIFGLERIAAKVASWPEWKKEGWAIMDKDKLTDTDKPAAGESEIECILDTVDAELGGDLHARLRRHIDQLSTQLSALRTKLAEVEAERGEAIKKTLGDFSEEYSALKWQNHEDGQTIHRLKSDLANLRSLLTGATTIDFEGIARSIQRLKSGRYKVYDYEDKKIAGQPENGFETIEQAFAWINEKGEK